MDEYSQCQTFSLLAGFRCADLSHLHNWLTWEFEAQFWLYSMMSMQSTDIFNCSVIKVYLVMNQVLVSRYIMFWKGHGFKITNICFCPIFCLVHSCGMSCTSERNPSDHHVQYKVTLLWLFFFYLTISFCFNLTYITHFVKLKYFCSRLSRHQKLISAHA